MPKGLFFTAVIFSSCFFLSFFIPTPNLWGHWTNLNQTWIHIHLWLLFEKFRPNSPSFHPRRAGGKNAFLGPTLNFDRTYICSKTWYQQSEKIVNIQGFHIHAPKTGALWSINGWEQLARFCLPPKFSLWESLPALPHGRFITDSRQTLARVM